MPQYTIKYGTLLNKEGHKIYRGMKLIVEYTDPGVAMHVRNALEKEFNQIHEATQSDIRDIMLTHNPVIDGGQMALIDSVRRLVERYKRIFKEFKSQRVIINRLRQLMSKEYDAYTFYHSVKDILND